MPPRTLGLLVFLFALAVYGATTGGSMATDIMTYEVAKNMVERGSVSMSRAITDIEAQRGADGRYYAPYGIGHALYVVPFYAAGRLVEDVTGLGVGKPEAVRKAFMVVGNAFAGALTVWVTYLFALRVGASAGAAVRTALALAFGTFLWPYSKFGFSAPLTALTVAWGLYGIWVGVRHGRPVMLWWGGAGLGSALLVRHELALVCLPVGLWIMAESGWRPGAIWGRAVRSALPVLAALGLTLYYNHVRFGNLFDTGYLNDITILHGSVTIGLRGLLASPGRSVFLFAPVTAVGLLAFVGFFGRDRSTAALFAGASVVLLLFYASLAYWDGDRSYGPRYLVAVLPLLCLPLAAWFDADRRSLRRQFANAVLAVSILVQLPGVLVDFSRVNHNERFAPLTRVDRLWKWQGSALCINTISAIEAVPMNIRYLAGTVERPRIAAADAENIGFAEQFAFSLDFWWLYLFHARAISATMAVVLATAAATSVLVLGWLVARTLAALERRPPAHSAP